MRKLNVRTRSASPTSAADDGAVGEPAPLLLFDHEVVAFEDAHVAHPVVAGAADEAGVLVGAVEEERVGIEEATGPAAKLIRLRAVGAADERQARHLGIERVRVGTGIDEGDAARLIRDASDAALLFECVEMLRDPVGRADREGVADLLERGRLVVLAEVGADVLEDTVLALGKRERGHGGGGMCGRKIGHGDMIFTLCEERRSGVI